MAVEEEPFGERQRSREREQAGEIRASRGRENMMQAPYSHKWKHPSIVQLIYIIITI
jgi:hypothetical protein